MIHIITREYIEEYIVSVLGQEEGYTEKYGLSPRDFPRAQPKGNPVHLFSSIIDPFPNLIVGFLEYSHMTIICITKLSGKSESLPDDQFEQWVQSADWNLSGWWQLGQQVKADQFH